MRIVLIYTRHFRGGGDSTYTLNLAEPLNWQGDEVAVFGVRDKRNEPDPNEDLLISPDRFCDVERRQDTHSSPAGARPVD